MMIDPFPLDHLMKDHLVSHPHHSHNSHGLLSPFSEIPLCFNIVNCVFIMPQDVVHKLKDDRFLSKRKNFIWSSICQA